MKIYEGLDISGITDPTLMASAINIQKQADDAKTNYDNKINTLNNQILALKQKQQEINKTKSEDDNNNQSQNQNNNSNNNSSSNNQVNEADNDEEIDDNEVMVDDIMFIMFETDDTHIYKFYNDGEKWVAKPILNGVNIIDKLKFDGSLSKEYILDYLSRAMGHIDELTMDEVNNILETL